MRTLLAAALAAALAAPAAASTKFKQPAWGPQGGFGIPTSGMADRSDPGPYLGVQWRYGLRDWASVGAELGGFLFDTKEEIGVSAGSFKTNAASLGAFGRFDFSEDDLLIPYALAGLSLNAVHTDLDFASAATKDVSDTSLKPGFFVGVGAEKDFESGYTLGLEFRYRTFEFGFDAAALTIGFQLSWPILPPKPRIKPGSYGL